MNISLKVTGLDGLLAKWRYISSSGLRGEMQDIAHDFSSKLLAAVQAKAPVETGGYRARITGEVNGYQVNVYSLDAFAARLEYGFVGVDSLGRHYAQPPQPHFRPAADEIGPQYVAALTRLIRSKAV